MTGVVVDRELARLRAVAAAALADRVPQHLGRLTWTPQQLRAHQRDALRATLARAKAQSPFHAERLRAIDPSTFELEDLAGLPVMSKADMMRRFDDIVTDRRLSLARVEQTLADTGADPCALPGDHVAIASGGSSGVRGVFVYPIPALADYLLGMVRPAVAAMSARGGPPPGGVPMALVAAGSAVHATRALAALFSGDLISVTSVPATLPLDEVVRRLNELQPLLLQGYPTLLAALATERRAGRLTIAPSGVTGTSEPFAAPLRAAVTEAFGVAPADQFGSSEGLVGVGAPGDEAIELATDLALVELVDERGDPVPPGTPSARVLVTTLFNPVQPLVRYELTDRFVAHTPAPSGRLRVTVEGRSDDGFVWGDVRIHPLAIRTVMVHTAAVAEYQVRQTAHGVDVDAVAGSTLDESSLRDEIASALDAAGLRSPQVRVRLVDEIARDARTAKVRRFVPSGAAQGT
jgi:phenylacetate-coenzyme A ligase PaaK-like adenylate-forming protein